MILSEEWKFIFIKGRKVAGTSIEMALSTIVGPNDIVTPITPIDEWERLRLGGRAQNYAKSVEVEKAYIALVSKTPQSDLARVTPPIERYFNHMPLRLVLANHPPAADFIVFCAERSPYSKILSYVSFALSSGSYRAGGEMRSDPAQLRHALDSAIESGAIGQVRNIDSYRDLAGKVAARPIHYECLHQEYESLMYIGVANPPPLPHAKKGLMSDRFDPREFFRADQIRKINDLFSDEFTTFGYQPL